MNKITAGFAVFAGAALAICFGAAQYAKGYYYEGGNIDIGFGQTTGVFGRRYKKYLYRI